MPNCHFLQIMTCKNQPGIVLVFLQPLQSGKSKAVVFFTVRKHSFDRFFSTWVDVFPLWCISDLVGLFSVFFPQVSIDDLYMVTALCALVPERTFYTISWIRFILPVSFPCRSRIVQHLGIWADIAIVFFIIDIIVSF